METSDSELHLALSWNVGKCLSLQGKSPKGKKFDNMEQNDMLILFVECRALRLGQHATQRYQQSFKHSNRP
jgi:hypothetical protein